MQLLKDLIQLNYRSTTITPPLSSTRLLRSSSFATVCPREEVLAAIHNVTRTQILEADSLLNFTLGTDFHSLLQDEILTKVGVISGAWKCKDCSRYFGPNRKAKFDAAKMISVPKLCKCGSTKFSYVEQQFKDDVYGITGHPDGFITLADRDGLGVIEAKSISKKGAAEIKTMPKFEHIIQAQIYMWFTNLKWACLFYWDKSTYGLNGLTEHYIDRDEETIELVKATLLEIKAGMAGGKLPDRLCVENTDDRALDCQLASICFPKKEQ